MLYSVKNFALQRGGEEMFEKNLAISDLLDQYEAVLTPRHKELLDYYYNQDLSLAEISALIGISRQGVRDGIKKAEDELFFMEERLQLHRRAQNMRDAAKMLLAGADENTAHAVKEMLRAAGIEPEGEGA